MINDEHIEGMLWTLTGMGVDNYKSQEIDPKDEKFLMSVARQTHDKGIALTERQAVVLATILLKHEDYLSYCMYNFNYAVTQHKLGLRKIDKSRWIRYEPSTDSIIVYFSFTVKLISIFESLRKITNHSYAHKKHYFPATGQNIKQIVTALKGKGFVIDKTITDHYSTIIEMENNLTDYMPCITQDYKFKNVHKNAVQWLEEKYGKLCNENLHLYQDKRAMYGIGHIPNSLLVKTHKYQDVLTANIASRTEKSIQISPVDFTFAEVMDSLIKLKRFPLLILVDGDNAVTQLRTSYNEIKKHFAPEEVSVLFRLDNGKKGQRFNEQVREDKLNSPVDQNTKIVYISKATLPKPILKAGWQPEAAIMLYSSKLHTLVGAFIEPLDLIIHYDDELSQWRSSNKSIQKITRNNAYI